MYDIANKNNFTIRDLYLWVAGARGHWTLVGTPSQVADELQSWFENGGADGFNLMPPVLPTGLDDIVSLLVPELRRRGLFRSEYSGNTLRDHLGLERPENHFVAQAQAVSAE
jgi:alkanesulfonate monooxygenase